MNSTEFHQRPQGFYFEKPLPVGIDNLSTAIGEEKDTIEDVFEPYLIMKGFIQRTRQGRILTQRGKNHIGLKTTAGPLFDISIQDPTDSGKK